MAKQCPVMYIGQTCGEWEEFPGDCKIMLNEGGVESIQEAGIHWLKDFARYFSPGDTYGECVLATAIREAILAELKSRN